jgi:hypothetical protein
MGSWHVVLLTKSIDECDLKFGRVFGRGGQTYPQPRCR